MLTPPLLLALLACRTAPPPTRVLVLAVDGMDWDVALPLVARGELPHLQALAEAGMAARLPTMHPTHSPIIWTTVATGRWPAEHQILGFDRIDEDGGGRRLYTSHDRAVPALWNVLSDAGRTSAVIGWWMTWPVEPIQGVMVAQTNTEAQIRKTEVAAGMGTQSKGAFIAGRPDQVHPPAREAELAAVIARTGAETDATLARILDPFPTPTDAAEARLWEESQWSLRADLAYLAVAHTLLDQPRDLTLLYLGGTDVLGHRYWRYRSPGEFDVPPDPDAVARLGEVIDDYYRFVDQELGRLIARVGPDTTVFVVSDHGMERFNTAGHFQPGAPPAELLSGNHRDKPDGVLVAAGPGVRRAGAPLPGTEAELPVVGGLLDLAPTWLTMLDVPLAPELDGEPMRTLLEPGIRPRAGASYAWEHWVAARRPLQRDTQDEAQRFEQLRALGYVE